LPPKIGQKKDKEVDAGFNQLRIARNQGLVGKMPFCYILQNKIL
jgi:hypothetical protein